MKLPAYPVLTVSCYDRTDLDIVVGRREGGDTDPIGTIVNCPTAEILNCQSMILIQTMIGTSTVILVEEGSGGVWMVITFATRVFLHYICN